MENQKTSRKRENKRTMKFYIGYLIITLIFAFFISLCMSISKDEKGRFKYFVGQGILYQTPYCIWFLITNVV